LETKERKKKLGVLFSKYSLKKYQKQLKISEQFAQVRKEMVFIIKETGSTESSAASWPRVEISLNKMEQAEKVFTENNLRMKEYGFHTLMPVYFPWQMQVQILMDHSSSFALVQLHILMKSTLFTVELFTIMTLC
jgi:hypothetical protein